MLVNEVGDRLVVQTGPAVETEALVVGVRGKVEMASANRLSSPSNRASRTTGSSTTAWKTHHPKTLGSTWSTHCSTENPPPTSRPMAGKATLTTDPSRNATPEPKDE